MLSSLCVTVSLGQAEVNHVTSCLLIVDSHEEVVRLHVAVEEVLGVHEFDPSDHLLC